MRIEAEQVKNARLLCGSRKLLGLRLAVIRGTQPPAKHTLYEWERGHASPTTGGKTYGVGIKSPWYDSFKKFIDGRE